jgi:hypothetical protein
MTTVNATFYIPKLIEQGLANGTYERIGGVIREANSKQIVAWLREGSEAGKILESVLPDVGAVSSILNLAISTIGFAVVLKRLGAIEKQLQQAQEVLRTIGYKIDISFYANFRSALDLAINAFTMDNSENRKLSAIQAINRFLEAEHHYTKLTDIEIGNGSQVADEYLSTLCLAYVTEVRCYLELEEINTARRRLQEGIAILRPRFEKHINTLLTSNPAAYLHPSLKEQVGLKRLTKVYQWLEPRLEESDVFELQRENIFKLAQSPIEWIDSLPQAIRIPKGDSTALTHMFNGLAKQSKKLIETLPSKSKKHAQSSETVTPSPEADNYGRLPAMMKLIETMVEDDNRLAMYESEIEAIHRVGISFQEWRQLAPSSTTQQNRADLIYITIS